MCDNPHMYDDCGKRKIIVMLIARMKTVVIVMLGINGVFHFLMIIFSIHLTIATTNYSIEFFFVINC